MSELRKAQDVRCVILLKRRMRNGVSSIVTHELRQSRTACWKMCEVAREAGFRWPVVVTLRGLGRLCRVV